MKFPAFDIKVPIYGLESPFLDSPDDFTISFEEMVLILIREIRILQSRGPYLLGGWVKKIPFFVIRR
jgi:thioesterase domain-containing protein